MIEEKDLSAESIVEAVKHLADNKEEREKMQEAVYAFGNPEAGKLIYDEMCTLLDVKEKVVKRGI